MERVMIDPVRPDPVILAKAGDILRRGGVVVFPSDTCYGLGADARNPQARARIVAMKQRDESKKFSVIVKDIATIERIAVVDDIQRAVLEHYLPGQYTFILMSADFGILGTNTIGIRMPDNVVTQGLAMAFGSPFISTSANSSGQPPIYTAANLTDQFLGHLDPTNLPDLVLDAGDIPETPPSTVVDLVRMPATIIRQGAVPFTWNHTQQQ